MIQYNSINSQRDYIEYLDSNQQTVAIEWYNGVVSMYCISLVCSKTWAIIWETEL